jgi:hypothetical protein
MSRLSVVSSQHRSNESTESCLFHSYHGIAVASRVTMSLLPRTNLACPFFVPLEILNDGSWPHPSRLPLGAGWMGNCRASGQEVAASDEHIREFCNLGYAVACPHLPAQHDWDAVRFSVANANSCRLTFSYVCELAHAPMEHGKLTFDLASEIWIEVHTDPRVARLADAYLESYRRAGHARQTAVVA